MTADAFLDGRVRLRQSVDGYRAGIDAVLLAAALPARGQERLLELGCGAGAALLCAAFRLPDGRFTGVEKDPAMAALARDNAAANGMADRVDILQDDVGALLVKTSFDQVFFNPPFFDTPGAIRPPRPEKRAAHLSGAAPLPVWIAAAAGALKPKGRLTLIHRAGRLAEILGLLDGRFGDVAVKPVHPRAGQPAKRVIVTARLGSRGPLTLLPPLVLHDDAGGKYSAGAEAILRGRAALAMA